jgi:hypothetical protein
MAILLALCIERGVAMAWKEFFILPVRTAHKGLSVRENKIDMIGEKIPVKIDMNDPITQQIVWMLENTEHSYRDIATKSGRSHTWVGKIAKTINARGAA